VNVAATSSASQDRLVVTIGVSTARYIFPCISAGG
jgi:hypothetical protein